MSKWNFLPLQIRWWNIFLKITLCRAMSLTSWFHICPNNSRFSWIKKDRITHAKQLGSNASKFVLNKCWSYCLSLSMIHFGQNLVWIAIAVAIISFLFFFFKLKSFIKHHYKKTLQCILNNLNVWQIITALLFLKNFVFK